MNPELALKIQAFVDGELSSTESASVRASLEKDPAAQALLTELRWSREVLAANPPAHVLPESPDFYWSKILREIRAGEKQLAQPLPVPGTLLSRALRWLVPIASVGLLVFLFVLPKGGTPPLSHPSRDTGEIAIADTSGLAFHSETDGMTVVWVQSDAN